MLREQHEVTEKVQNLFRLKKGHVVFVELLTQLLF